MDKVERLFTKLAQSTGANWFTRKQNPSDYENANYAREIDANKNMSAAASKVLQSYGWANDATEQANKNKIKASDNTEAADKYYGGTHGTVQTMKNKEVIDASKKKGVNLGWVGKA